MTVVVLIIVSLFILSGATTRLIRANRIYAKSVRDLIIQAERPRELAKHRNQLDKKMSELEKYTSGLLRRNENLKMERAEIMSQLEVLQARKKDDVYALERIMQPGLDVWEVTISNATYFDNVPAEEFKLSWALGRTYVVAAPNESEARRRAELKFLSSQGYKISKVVKSARF